MASFGSGFSGGLLAGTALGTRMVDIYHQGVEAEHIKELRGRQDEEYARQQEDRKIREGMNREGATAAQGGYDTNGFKRESANPAYDVADGPGVQNPQQATIETKDGRRPEDKVLDGITAAEQFAMKNKRFDLALDAHVKGEQLSGQYRDKRAAEALQQYDLTGDPMTLVGFTKRFVRDGTDFDAPTRNADGTVTVTGKMADGTPFKKENLKPDEVKRLFMDYANPQQAQAAAVKRAQDLQKAMIEVEIKKAGLPAQAFDAGKKIWNEQTKTWATVPGVDYKTVKGGEGEGDRLIAITYGSNGQVGAEVDVTRHVANVNGFSKAENARADDVAKGINSALDLEKSQGMGMPELSALSIKANSTASDLIAANRGSGVNLEAGKIADYAMKIARGDKSVAIQPLEVKYNGIVYGKADGFIVDGKPVYTNPQQVREIEGKILADKREAAAPRMSSTPDRPINAAGKSPRLAQSPADFPRVAPTEQAARDGDRAQILGDELAAERAKPNPNPDNIAALERELALVNGKRAPAVSPTAPTAAAPAPAAAAAPMSAAPKAPVPKPTMTGAVIPPEQRAAQMAQLTEVSNRAQAVLNSRSASPAQMSEARTALRDVRAQLKELGASFTPETARLQSVIANPRSSPADVADARATLRAIRDRNSTTASLPMSQ